MKGKVLVIDGAEWRVIGRASWSDSYWIIESPTGQRSVRSDAVLRRHFERIERPSVPLVSTNRC